jgi:hypothetical protein
MTIYLYVKRHNLTGLLYFGKTSRPCPYSYLGSGKYWLRHLRVHGQDITTLKVWEFHDVEECRVFALTFSAENDIVESTLWANLRPENGIDGGVFGQAQAPEHIAARSATITGRKRGPMPKERKERISHSLKGRKMAPHSDMTKLKMSFAARGANNVNFGKALTDEQKENISQHQRGRPKKSETKAQMKIGACLRQVTVLEKYGKRLLIFSYKDFCQRQGVSKYALEKNFKENTNILVDGWRKIGAWPLSPIQKDYFQPYLSDGAIALAAENHPKIG